MKKIIALTLIGCMLTSLTACGTVSQQDNRPTTEYSTENEGENPAHEPVDPIDDGYWHDDPTEEPTTEEPTSQPQTGAYTYNVYGYTISMDINVDDYITGDWFLLAEMAYDLDWVGNDIYTSVDTSDPTTYSSKWFAHHDGDITTRIDLGYYNEEQVTGTNGYQFRTIGLMYLANEGGMYYADDDSDVMHRNTLCSFGKHYSDCEYKLNGTGWYASYEDIVMITYIFWTASTNPGNNPMIPSFGTNTDFVSSLDNRTIQYSLP